MVESLVELLKILNTLSPLAVIALLAVIIYVIVWKQPTNRDFVKLTTNDLHELPEIAASLRRMEITMSENFAYIKARLERGRP